MGSTLRQIALECGVAVSTVSRALNGHPHVNEETRQRIRETAERLGYRPSAAARALRGSGTRTVGVVLPDMMNAFYARTISMVQDQLEERGYSVVMAVTNNEGRRERTGLDRLIASGVDGIIVVPTPTRRPPTPEGPPLVEMNRRSSRRVDWVGYDEDEGAHALVGLLVGADHRDIAFIGGQPSFSTTRRRLEGYRRALAEAGVEPDPRWVQLRAYSPDWGSEALERLLALRPAPTAVCASSSELVLGLLTGARRRGLRLPSELSLVAFGKTDWYAVTDPGITTYEQPIEQVSHIAVQLLADRMAGSTADPTTVLVEGRVVERDSVAAPPTGPEPPRGAAI